MKTRTFKDWQDFNNILCIRPDNLGDVLMTTPAIRALKESRPGRRITLLTSRAGATIARHVPYVDDIVVFDPPWYRHAGTADADDVSALVKKLAAARFDGAVVFTVFSQNPLPTAMLAWLARIPRIAGYCRENPYHLMTDWVPDTEPLYGARHEVQRQLDLATMLGAVPRAAELSLRIPPGQEDAVGRALLDAGVEPREPWVILHPGASEARRRYPARQFAAAARLLRDRLGLQVVVTGSADEGELAGDIAARAGDGVFSVAGALSLDALIALIAMAPLVVSNNTGPVHIAAATQTPVVVLYALTNPQHAPWRVPHRVLPFEVPPEKLSRNVLVRYAAERYFTRTADMPGPNDIVQAARELLEAGIKRAACATAPVPWPTAPGAGLAVAPQRSPG